ncbi:hypothetical protein C0995_010223 [Termitomyces sp. Mi166|nr:hypothetical protein C0995_010223 [Termitomyces sp. Mi166\
MGDTPSTSNIILFGESGSGKSSIINMISQSDVAPVGGDMQGVTLDSTRYKVDLEGATFNLYDTAGLNEAKGGSVLNEVAIIKLYQLLKSLKSGVNLLIYCVRSPRLRDTAYQNWHLFYEIICRRKVPIVLAVTGLENDDDRGQWWRRNKGNFQDHEMHPNGIACITATRGKQKKSGKWTFDEEYEESRVQILEVITTHCLHQAWKMSPLQWFRDVIDVHYEHGTCPWDNVKIETVRTVAGAAVKQLVERCEMSEEDAWELARVLSKA